jgi:hypothetical protein
MALLLAAPVTLVPAALRRHIAGESQLNTTRMRRLTGWPERAVSPARTIR